MSLVPRYKGSGHQAPRYNGPGHLLALGSNVAPAENVAAMLDALLDCADHLYVSRIARTPPIGLSSTQTFLNLAVFLPTSMPADALKAHCVAAEIALGRDRNHPDRKHQDRPADIDLISRLNHAQTDPVTLPDEPYLAPFVADVLALLRAETPPLLPWPSEAIRWHDKHLGETPTTIHRDHRSGLIRVGKH